MQKEVTCAWCSKVISDVSAQGRNRLYCSLSCQMKASRERKKQRQQTEVAQARLESMQTLDEHEEQFITQIEALKQSIEASTDANDAARLEVEAMRVQRDKLRQVCRELDFGLTHKALIFNPKSPYYQQFMQMQNWGQFVHAWAHDNADQESVYEMEKKYWHLEQEWTYTINLCIAAARRSTGKKYEHYSNELDRLHRERSAWRKQYLNDHPQIKALKELRNTIDEIRDLEGQEPSPYDPRLEPLFREAFGYVLLDLPSERPSWAHY